MSIFGSPVGETTSLIDRPFLPLMTASRTLYPVRFTVSGLSPTLIVRHACGSQSIRRTRLSCSLRPSASAATVVVLPTPPFWLAIQSTGIIYNNITQLRNYVNTLLRN